MERDWDTGGQAGVTFRMPLCFVIDRRGKIAFVGHPEDDQLVPTLKRVLAEK
ncbi:MAG: hypothetical protein WBP29_08380 [Candidatus Zixiibacteriota bacterium]